MTMSKQILRIVRRIVFNCAAMVLSLGPISAGIASAAEGLQVQIDQTVPIKLDRSAATIVVGNPAVADIAAQSNNLFFIVGRTMGTTNVVALDAAGDQIANVTIHVTSVNSGQVSLHRSTFRESYSCAPNCERTQMPGDEKESYKSLVEANTQKLSVAKQGREASN
jgi:Flp pilus assembly secretin CpaC